ncbi:5-hydroxytryptamine receptor 4-like [Branchiostoma floridae x Branchiostoma japonicum]
MTTIVSMSDYNTTQALAVPETHPVRTVQPGANGTNDSSGCTEAYLGPQYSLEIQVLLSSFLALVILLTIVGNILVISTVALFRSLRSLTNYFVVSLAVADLLVGVIVMTLGTQYEVSGRWRHGEIFCLIFTSMDISLTTCSIMHLSCIAFDRYYAICHPFKYPTKMSHRKMVLMIAMCWVVPVIMAYVPIMNRWNTIGIEPVVEDTKCALGPESCVFLVNKEFSLIASTLSFYLPAVMMTLAYYQVYRAARRQMQQIISLERSMNNNENMRREKKAAKTLGIIMGCFLVCWMPFFVANIVEPLCGYCITRSCDLCLKFFLWLGYINSTLNPMIYAFFNRSFRRAFKRILSCSSCCDLDNRDFDPAVSTALQRRTSTRHQNGEAVNNT